jgi:WD40 repeat protein
MKDAGESVIFSPDSSKVATTTSNPFAMKFYVRIWDVTTGAELQRLNHEAPVGPVDFQQVGNKIVTACSSTALIWDVATGTELKRLDHSSSVRLGLASFSPDGSKLATNTYYNDTVRIWDVTTGAEIQKLPQKSDRLSNPSPTSILFSTDGSKMAVSVDDETVRIWDITT